MQGENARFFKNSSLLQSECEKRAEQGGCCEGAGASGWGNLAKNQNRSPNIKRVGSVCAPPGVLGKWFKLGILVKYINLS